MPDDLVHRLRTAQAGGDASRAMGEAADEIERLQRLAQTLRLGMVTSIAAAVRSSTGGKLPQAWLDYIRRVAHSVRPPGPSMVDAVEAAIAADTAAPVGATLLQWAVERWQDEVANRPLFNIHRRSLDDAWRQVIRYAGGDPVALIGPAHDDLHTAAPPTDRAPVMEVMTVAERDVLAERRRQVEVEGYTPERDDGYVKHELSIAAAIYAAPGARDGFRVDHRPKNKILGFWPWPRSTYRPADRRRELVKAGALILAELERLDRAKARPPEGDTIIGDVTQLGEFGASDLATFDPTKPAPLANPREGEGPTQA